MGTISKGILGGFSGTVGTVIGGTWKGITYMRSKPDSKTRVSSPAQAAQRAKFAEIVGFESTMTSLVETSFKSYAVKMTGYNNAVSYNLKNAVTGKFPDYTIDYSMALVSRGDLPNASSPAATATNGIVYFTWTDNSGLGKAQNNDAAILVVYCEARKMTIYTLRGGSRSDGAGSIDVSIFKGNTVETWLGFISADGKDVANSFYTGELIVS